MKLHERDILIVHVKGSGPGGQHRNKRETGIRITHIPTGIVAMATEERHQVINLMRAKERLIEKLTRYYFKPKKRIKTKSTKGSKEKRLQTKRKASLKKSFRKPIRMED